MTDDAPPDLQGLLGRWCIATPTSVEPIGEFRLWIVTCGDDSPLVLKDRGPTAEAADRPLDFHADVMTHLDAHGIGVPLPLRVASGHSFVDWNDHRYTLSRFQRAGRPPTRPLELRLLHANVGRELARLHRALAAFPAEGVATLTWREHLPAGLVRWTDTLQKSAPAEHHPAIEAAAARTVQAQDLLADLGDQLIHRDCHPGNVLVDGTRVVGFVDCDHFCLGPRLFDLAYYAIHVIKWQVDEPAAVARWLEYVPALLDGYSAGVPLRDQERAAFPEAMTAVLLLFAAWFTQRDQRDVLDVELNALRWLLQNLDQVRDAATPRGGSRR